ncbi:GNAT family N-acetyltransferase [Pseudoalteromonas maricaloris]|uniref:GNAT family N-acetyltransferase n=1 Tax=Pseudoalteromonas maricaloris TaxID=184924 RepID=UPI00029A4AE2|nr:GNAT family protein [Pseudoalteromonas flavipulchra]
MWPANKPLIGQHVTLEPLSTTHINALQQAVKDGEAWKLWYANVPTPDDMERYVNTAISQGSEGNLAYAVRLNSSNEIVGTTRYYNTDIANRRAMLGYTWYSDKVRRTAVNTECKLLLLQQLFEDFDAIAVEFRTHFFNHASRNAIERLGAKLDGILRSHQIGRNGELRDTVVYSIIASEWPTVKQHLLSKLDR